MHSYHIVMDTSLHTDIEVCFNIIVWHFAEKVCKQEDIYNQLIHTTCFTALFRHNTENLMTHLHISRRRDIALHK